MLFHNKRLYRTALNAKLGTDRSPKLLRELKKWIETRYSVSVVLLKYDTIDIGPHAGRPRLNVIVETDADYIAIHKDAFTLKSNVKSEIAFQFSRLVAEADATIFRTENIHIISDIFSYEAMRISTAEFITAKLEEAVREFSMCGLWTLTAMSREIIAFFFTDAQIAKAKQNGCADRISDYSFSHVIKYDPFVYFARDNFPIRFDSKENFDKNYQSNWYYYFK
jgi:hypothetical protein